LLTCLRQDIAERFKKKQFKKRSLATVPFQISPDVHIGIKLYDIPLCSIITVLEIMAGFIIQIRDREGIQTTIPGPGRSEDRQASAM